MYVILLNYNRDWVLSFAWEFCRLLVSFVSAVIVFLLSALWGLGIYTDKNQLMNTVQQPYNNNILARGFTHMLVIKKLTYLIFFKFSNAF